MSFDELKDLIHNSKRILISTHVLPDGDGLGAEHALFHYLKRGRKSCRVYNPDPTPKRFKFLDPKSQVLLGPGEVEIWDTFDLWIVVDTNDPRRLGKIWSEMVLRARKIVFLDHHPETLSNGEPTSYPPHATVVSDTTAGSIGEMLFHLFQQLDFAKLNKEVGLGLYVSIMTDTNSFRYARTTPASHRIAAELIELGVNPEEVYQSIYSSKDVNHIQLLGSLLQSTKTAANGKIAWMEVDQATRLKHRANSDDTLSFMNLLLLLRDAQIVCLFREEDNGQIRVSMKSKGQVVINQLAMQLGGGGHEYSAGLALTASMATTVDKVIKGLTEAVAAQDKPAKLRGEGTA